MDIIICGHSLGGAIASIVSIRLLAEKVRYKLPGYVKCITFGAPLFGDAMLQKNFDSKNMHHFVCNNDPVPYILNYTQTISSFMNGIDGQISSLANKFPTREGQSYHKKHIEDLLNKKQKFVEMLSIVEPIFSSLFEIASLLHPGMKVVNDMKKLLGVMSDINLSTTTKQNVYVPIGNFYFLSNQKLMHKCYKSSECDIIQLHFQSYYEKHINDINTDAHSVESYTHTLQLFEQPRIPFQNYCTHIEEATQSDFCIPIPRVIKFTSPYIPVIHSVKLSKVDDRDTTILRLSFTGLHLFDVVLSLCEFHFNYPFAGNIELTTVKKLSMGEQVQRVIIEEPYKEDLAISDHYDLCDTVWQMSETNFP